MREIASSASPARRFRRTLALAGALAALAGGSALAQAPAQAAPAADPSSPAEGGSAESCTDCHAGMLQRRVLHAAMKKTTCASCHKAAPGRVGKCKSATSSAWALTKPQGDLCKACHDEKDTAGRFAVKHDFKGKCVECHDAHGSDQPKLMRASGKKLCLTCHDSRSGRREVVHKIDLTRKVVHAALEKKECQDCHDAGHGGTSANLLKRGQPELCYGCHKRQDQYKNTHTAVRQGECLECHDAHSSNLPALAKRPRDEICLSCHEVEPLLTRSVKHAPVAEGKCLDCHAPHGGERPAFVLGTGKALCMKCHDPKAATGKGTATAAYRVDLGKKYVHAALLKGECTDCHDPGHSGDYLKLLKKSQLDLCYGCHTRKDNAKFVHSAVRLGDCVVCHAPHASDVKGLLAKGTTKEMCFTCHQDDVTGRASVHRPVADGKCDECHASHGAPSRWVLTKGEGKKTCYACHKPVDGGKVRHAALDRYGCASCHDPHGAGNKFLLAKKVNEVCSACHEQHKSGRHVTPMIAAGHIVDGPTDPRRPDHPFSCASCHNPHGSDSPKLFYFGASPMESCDGCHGDKSGKRPQMKSVVQKRPEGADAVGAGSGSPGGGSGATAHGAGYTLWPEVATRYGVSTDRPAWKNWFWPPEKPRRAAPPAADAATPEGK